MAEGDNSAEIVQKLDAYFRASLDHPTWRLFRDNAKLCFDYKEGNQWTAAELAELEQRHQPPTVNNQVAVTVDRMVGQFVQTRTRTMFRGRNAPMDDPVANVLTDLYRADSQTGGIPFEERDVFEDAATCGFGCFHLHVTFDDAGEAQILVDWADALEMFPDPHSRKYDWNRDATFICRAKWMPFTEAVARWPEKAQQLRSFGGGTTGGATGDLDAIDGLRNDNYIDFDDKGNPLHVRIVECWYKEHARETKEVRPGVKLERAKTRMKVGVFTGWVLLEHGDSPHQTDLFPFVPFFFKRTKAGTPYSPILTALSMQDAINKRESKALHLLSVNQAIYEQNAVADKERLADELAKPDGQIEVTKIDKIKLEKNLDLAQAQHAMHGEAKADFRRITGVNPDALGEASEVRSGVGIARKVAMTDLILMPGFDNFRRTRQMLARCWQALVQRYYDEEKSFLVTDDFGAARVVAYDATAMEAIRQRIYDVVIDEMPDIATLQQEQMGILMQNLPAFLQYGPGWAELFVQMSDIRNKEEVLARIKNMAAPPSPLPTVSVSLKWEELSPTEKIAWAGRLGMPALAQAQMEDPQQPATAARKETEITREEIRAQTEADRIEADLDRTEMQVRTQMATAQVNAQARAKQKEESSNGSAV